MKDTTCAVIVRFDGKLLLVHSTGLPWDQWGLPKGIADPGEAFDDAAVRETLEETGYVVPKDQLRNLGVFPYTDEKDIALFLYDAPTEPDTSAMVCTSLFFCDKKQKDRPEVDSFKMVPYAKFPVYFRERMRKLYEIVKPVIEI